MRKPRRRDREATAAAVIGGVFVALGVWIMTRPGGLVDGGLVVVFFGSVAMVGLARLRADRDQLLPSWAVLVGAAGFTVACVALLVDVAQRPGPWSTGQVVMAVACVLGAFLFGVGGIAYAIVTLRHQRPKDP